MSVMKELSSRWFISAHDHIRANPDIVKNGFKKAGITDALKKGLPDALTQRRAFCTLVLSL